MRISIHGDSNMAQLNSPGVSVSVIDESFYTPAAPGTVPLIIVASAENKQNGAGTGTAPGTLATDAGNVRLLTSQKDLSDIFGTPVFQTDANNNPIHAGELNEYGLQAAYSYLGVSNRAYVVRADVDLGQLEATATAPAGEPANGTLWFDTASTKYGIFEWNGASATTTGGQTFTNKVPTVITEVSKLVDGAVDGAPLASIGAVGDYAIVATTTLNVLYFKKPKTDTAAGWVKVGSTGWLKAWPTVQGLTPVNGQFGKSVSITINGTLVSVTSDATIGDLAAAITAAPITGVTAAAINFKLEIYSDGSGLNNGNIIVSGTDINEDLGIVPGTYKLPALAIDKHTNPPSFRRTSGAEYNNGGATGSIWVKTTNPNLGADWIVKQYNESTQGWTIVSAPLYANNAAALAGIDPTGGGINIPNKGLYVKYNDDEGTPAEADFKIYARNGAGAMSVTSAAVEAGTFSALSYSFSVSYSNGNDGMSTEVPVSFNAAGTTTDAQTLVSAINTALAGTVVVASKTTDNRVVISHTKGGDIVLVDNQNTPLNNIFAVGTTANLQADPAGNSNTYVATLWIASIGGVSVINTGSDAPTTIPADGRLWYNSIVDEVDIMVHDGAHWKGYRNVYPGTDPNGPQVSATAPEKQSDDVTPLVTGDLWIDTSDLENYPRVYRYNEDLANRPVAKRWVLVDNTDQTTEDGILFADARWATDGGTPSAQTDSSIRELLVNDFLDFDAPDPALYPRGMLLWNLRRSGFNVKKYVVDYVDTTTYNRRYAGANGIVADSIGEGQRQTNYYPNRWVSVAANQENGAGTFGRKAQRRVVIQALQATVNSNQQIRDEESRIFNLIACPGYPELIGEMVNLNTDRGLTAFVVGDTPARLAPDATTLSNWGMNVAGALEDGDQGAVSFDEYMGMFYPWGYTSDNLGNNIVVPPSHMVLRTIALSDNVSYPWFAPAGTRRGGITNATAVGYVDAETGEFQSVALNNGQRDTLASIKVNPITFITGTGLVNYGQYTRAKNASALDRINVARLVIYLRRQFAQLAKPYVFEPNDKITRDEIKGAAENLLLELVGQRAVYDYVVVCDTSNNTPARIDRNELYLDVAIEPVKAVEFIYIPLRLKNTGEIKALGK